MEKLSFPNRITVELTNRCNVSCTFCPRQSLSMKTGDMDISLFKKIIDEASEHLPVKLVLFFRGESLLHPQFFECLEYAKKKGIGPIQFATNALALTPEFSEKMVESGIDFISFSLDTIDKEVYEKSRETGNLDKSMEHVRYISALCEERRRAGENAPTLQVSTIEIPDYMPRQKEFIDYWLKYVDIVRVYYEHDDKGNFRDAEVLRKMPVITERQACRKVFTDLLVYWDGQLALCNYDWRGGLNGLNLNRMTIQEAWDSDLYENVRKMQQENNYPDGIMCKECQHWRIDYMPNGFLGKMYRSDKR